MCKNGRYAGFLSGYSGIRGKEICQPGLPQLPSIQVVERPILRTPPECVALGPNDQGGLEVQIYSQT